MFERYTDRARRVIVLAIEETRALGCQKLGTEHLLMACVSEGEGVAYQALSRLGITLEEVRARAGDLKGTGKGSPSGSIPFTRAAKRTCEYALRESLQLGHSYIGTEHILLALVRVECTATQVLAVTGLSGLEVRAKVLELLHGYEQAAKDASPPSVPRLEAPPVAPERAHDFPAGLVDLAVMLSDLEGYIERRAAELAAPAIRESERLDAVVRERIPDLRQEFGRQIDALRRQVARWREIAEGKATDLIVRWDEVRPGDRVLGESVGLCLVREVSDNGDHLSVSLTDDDGRNWHVTGMPATLTAVRRTVPEVPDGC